MKLIRISAIWCPACLIMRPRIDEIVKENDFESVEYDYDMDEDIVEKYNVGETLPVFILLKDDKEVLRIIGEKTKEQIKEMVDAI